MDHLPPWRRRECRRVARVLQAYLDGELGADRADMVSEHLERCRRCGIDERIYRQVKRSLRGLAVTPDPRAVQRLRAYADDLQPGAADAD